MRMKALFVFSIAASVFTFGDAIQCYICTGCKEPFSSSAASVKNCTQEQGPGAMCAKIIREFHSGKELTARDCIKSGAVRSLSSDVEKSDMSDNDTVTLHMYVCKEDLCNGASSFSPALGLLLISVISVFLMIHNKS
ncbi:uncharacterized protein [Fopius arisanus]|uniref:Protein sleepless n=1 Tax=Fopius arisanus TaxID=64838 RepID=A0A9R1T6G5_9HYME|nr:PREDICTED: uncharacterized protein LOC105266874 [Fopius arisanus]